MIYLIPKFDCFILNHNCYKLYKNAKYIINNFDKPLVLCCGNAISQILELRLTNKNILKVEHGGNTYLFLFNNHQISHYVCSIKHKNKELILNVGVDISLTLEGEIIHKTQNVNLVYSHYEIVDDFCLIYFEGKRNFVIILKDKDIMFSNFYDECNVNEKERVFMCKLYDSLNHGKVVNIKDNKFESYLVYLADEDLNLKNEFIPFVFLDCVVNGNFKYCNYLLDDNIKLNNGEGVKNFFPKFDDFYPIDAAKFILIKKNTLAGICKFEIENNKIVNIIQ